MTTETATLHGGRLIARRLKAHGVSKLFTLSGGHLFSIYDGCRAEGIDIVDVRHESAAAFAAEGWAKVTREPGVCALTAGPGVTNGMSAVASAQHNNSPMLVLGGRAPAMRWGQGSLQEIDHVPFMRPLTKLAATAESPDEIPGLVDEALRVAARPHSGPVFLDFPLDVVFSEGSEPEPQPATAASGGGFDEDALDRAAALLREAERPVIMAGTNLYWGRGEGALRTLAEARGIPVFLNGLARGCLPADHELFFSRARGAGLKGADLALVIGVPMDFRLGFGASFGEETELVVIDVAEPERDHPRPVAAELYGELPGILSALAASAGSSTRDWVAHLRAEETAKREAERAEREDDRAPAASDAPVRRARVRPRPRRDRHRRRRRLRLLRGPGRRLLRARLLAGPGPVRLPRLRPRLRARGQARPPGPPGRAAPRRRSVRLLRHGMGHPGPARGPRRRSHGQQRHLGAREAPDGVPLRLLRGGRAPRPRPATTRWSRRWEAKASWCESPRSSGPRWSGRWQPPAQHWSTSSRTRPSPTPGDRTWPREAPRSRGRTRPGPS